MKKGKFIRLAATIAVLMLLFVFPLAACGDKADNSGGGDDCAHANAAWVETVPPDCTQKGEKELKCPDCNEVLDTGEVPATGHVHTSWQPDEAATCTESGSEKLVCADCGSVLETRATKPAGHTESEEWTTVKSATCTEDGIAVKLCTECGESLDTDTIPMLGHSYGDWIVKTAPTLTEGGERYKVCAHDITHVQTQQVPELGDDTVYAVTATPASCNAAGRTVYSSDTYGSYTLYTPKADHDHSQVATSENCPVCGTKIASRGLVYTLNSAGDGYIVSRSRSDYSDADLVIPAEYNGLPVTQIEGGAFAEIGWIENVTIPESIKVIGDGAFSQMDGLKKVFYNAVRCRDLEGRNWAFYPGDDQKPFDVVIGAKVERIPARLFFPLYTAPHYPARVGTLSFEEGSVLEEIGEDAFYRSTLSGGVVFPATLKRVEYRAFYGTRITSVTFGEDLEELGNYVFTGCDKLETVVFGRSLQTIGLDAFNQCAKLGYIDLSVTSVTDIAANAFKGCVAVTTVKLPEALRHIGDSAFEGAALARTLVLNDGLLTVGKNAFRGWTSLAELTIPASLTTIGAGAFQNAVSLQKLYYNAVELDDLDAGNGVFTNAGSGVSDGVAVVIGAGVRRIAARLFYSTSNVDANISVKKLTIAASVTAIGDRAFYGVTVTAGEYLGDAAGWAAVSKGTGNSALDSIVVGAGE